MSARGQLMKEKLFTSAKSVIPTEFYDVREETTPKAGWVPMFGFTIIIYVTAVAAFTALYFHEANKSTVETTVVPYDNSGNDGYTCQMISRVTASYQYPTKTDPALAYELVNVIESKSQCESGLQISDPCSLPLTYFPGTATARSTTGVDYRATALYGDEIAFMLDVHDLGDMFNYTYTTGLLAENVFQTEYPYNGHDTFNLAANGMAVDRNGYPIFAAYGDESAQKIIFRSSPYDSGVDSIAFNTEWEDGITLLNDNLYNVYLIENSTFLALDVYSSPAVSTVMFNVTGGDNILYAAVYHDGTTPSVYYYTQSSVAAHIMYCYRDGETSELDAFTSEVLVGLLADGSGNIYSAQHIDSDVGQAPGTFFVARYDTENGEYLTVGTFTELTKASHFAINPAGTRIMAVEKNLITGVENWAFMYLDPSAVPSTAYGSDDWYSAPTSEVVTIESGFGAGFFTCGAQVLNTTQYTPGLSAEYPQDCPANGIVGKIVYNQPDLYVFTPTDAAAYAVNNAAAYCDSLYAPICATVSNLPPYSCSRELKQGFFNCAATAVANTQFLVQLLIFLCAMVLPKLAAKYPFEVSTPAATAAAAVGEKSAEEMGKNGDLQATGRDIEMGTMYYNNNDIANPMQQ